MLNPIVGVRRIVPSFTVHKDSQQRDEVTQSCECERQFFRVQLDFLYANVLSVVAVGQSSSSFAQRLGSSVQKSYELHSENTQITASLKTNGKDSSKIVKLI